MKGLKDLLKSKFFNRILLSITIVLALSQAISADQGWIEQESTGAVGWTTETGTEINYGELFTDYSGLYRMYLQAYTKLEKGVTYKITYTIEPVQGWWVTNFEGSYAGTNISTTQPTVTPVFTQTNTNGEAYSDLVTVTRNYDTIEILFSTATGFIDNLEWGENWVTVLYHYNKTDPGSVTSLSGVTVQTVIDPEAEWYTQQVLNKLDQVGDELELVVGEASLSENWAIEKAKEIRLEYGEKLDNNLNLAKSLVMPTRSGTGNVIQSAQTFGMLLTNTLTAMPAKVQVLIVVLPLLALIGWILGRIK